MNNKNTESIIKAIQLHQIELCNMLFIDLQGNMFVNTFNDERLTILSNFDIGSKLTLEFYIIDDTK
jgi:hypothetical protein